MRMSANLPAYRQVAELLRERITAGWYPDTLPSKPLLATELGVHEHVVHQALGALSREGRLECRRGHRARVPARSLAGLVPVAPGQLVFVRMPTYQERLAHDVPEGVPILLTDGRIYRADQFAIIGDVHRTPRHPN